MIELRNRFDETVRPGILMDGYVVHVGCEPSRQPLKMAAALDERAWPHVSALGKCLLAWAPDETLDTVLRLPLREPTTRSTGDHGAIAADLARVRELGYAVDDEESGAGVRCIGAPVHDAHGAVVAAISVSAPADRVPRARVHEISSAVIGTADEIARRMGWVRH